MNENMPQNVENDETINDSSSVNIPKKKVKYILSYKNASLLEIPTEKSLMESDEDLLKKHNSSFADLLSNYVVSSDKSQKHKRGMKIAFFVIAMTIIIVLSISFVITIVMSLYMQCTRNIRILDLIAPIASSFASVVIAVLTIPKIIAQYLFDKSEDDRLSQMVGKMQDYDKEIRNNRNPM